MNRRLLAELVDSSLYHDRLDRKEDSRDNNTYGEISGTSLIVDGVTFLTGDYLVYDHVGTLSTGDVVEVDHAYDKKRITVIGKVIAVPLGDVIGATKTARKTANETVTSSTVMQNDDHLSIVVQENCVYSVEAYFVVGGNDVEDFKYQFTYPASATLAGGQINMLASLAGAASTSGDGEWRGLAAQTTPSTALTFGIPDTNLTFGIYKGTLIMSATGGNIALQWAQNTSGLTGTTLYAGSALSIRRMA